jgi:hypothetical protein
MFLKFTHFLSLSFIFLSYILLQEKDKPNSTTMNGSPGSANMGDSMGVKIEPAEAESLSMSGSSGILTPVSPYACAKPISPEQEELINRLVSFQCEFEQPSEEDLKRITVRILFFIFSYHELLECLLRIFITHDIHCNDLYIFRRNCNRKFEEKIVNKTFFVKFVIF